MSSASMFFYDFTDKDENQNQNGNILTFNNTKLIMKKFIIVIFSLINSIFTYSQISENEEDNLKDSLFIAEVENAHGKTKVLHAEPLYIDLIRDLGARKGEKEWNVGFGLNDNNSYSSYTALVEYEWAPIDRLGLEVELPFTFYYRPDNTIITPGSRLNSLKLAGQYSFFVSERLKTSMALGYIHEFEAYSFQDLRFQKIYKGNVFNPFFVGAKRFGNNFHTLIYTGPMIEQSFNSNNLHYNWQVNTNFHYMISGTRNFIGLEVNKDFHNGKADVVLRPQMRVGIADNLLVGIVTGIPFSTSKNERFSTFIRIIYEPSHRKAH